jgi:uncharacterized membrane protein
VSALNRKYIETESRRWVEAGIVTPEQAERIAQLYGDLKHNAGLVPLLGGILIGLGILSFTAANWQAIPELLRLIIILAAMGGFYAAGDTVLKRGQERIGIALLGLGLLSFGAGIVLIAQMFHLEAYDVTSWVVWGTAGLLLTALYRSRYLYTIAAVIFLIAQWYSVTEFGRFSYAAFAIGTIGLGWLAWKRRDAYPVWLLSLGFAVQSVMLVASNDRSILWAMIPIAILYTLGDMLPNRKAFYPLQSAALLAAFVFDWLLVVLDSVWLIGLHRMPLPPFLPLFGVLALLFLTSLYWKSRSGRSVTLLEWMLFPILAYATDITGAVYTLLLFAFSLYVLWRGYAEERRSKINLGTVLFLISAMTAYGKLTWSFMDKSMFFIIGGVLLLALSWVLNRRKNRFLTKAKEDDGHDD